MFAMYNGVIYNDSTRQDRDDHRRDEQHVPVRRAQPRHARCSTIPYYYVSDNSWQSGRWYDTLFSTFYPMT